MNISFVLCAILLVNIHFSLANNDKDEDSSEYGVVEGDIGTNCTCGFVNKEVETLKDGEEVKIIEWPMIAELAIKNVHYCGGTVITKRHIITAAHCGFWPSSLIKLQYNKFKVNLGISEIKEGFKFIGDFGNVKPVGGKPQVFGIDQFIVHPDYDPKTTQNDIAVIYLNGDIDFSTKNVGPACLPVGNENIQGAYLKVLGWGKPTGKITEATRKLIQNNAQVVTASDCKSLYKNYYEDSEFCTYTENKDLCGGDSSAQLLWSDPDTNKYVLVGIYTFTGGKNCAKPTPDINITWFLPWIQRTIEATDSSLRTCSKKTS